jgi:hypothetical protein
MPMYDTVSEEVEAVQWTGSNVEAIITLVGMDNVLLDAGNLRVYKTPVPTDAYVVKSGGVLREVVPAGAFGAKYVPV